LSLLRATWTDLTSSFARFVRHPRAAANAAPPSGPSRLSLQTHGPLSYSSHAQLCHARPCTAEGFQGASARIPIATVAITHNRGITGDGPLRRSGGSQRTVLDVGRPRWSSGRPKHEHALHANFAMVASQALIDARAAYANASVCSARAPSPSIAPRQFMARSVECLCAIVALRGARCLDCLGAESDCGLTCNYIIITEE
jgi:hypothetical protein